MHLPQVVFLDSFSSLLNFIHLWGLQNFQEPKWFMFLDLCLFLQVKEKKGEKRPMSAKKKMTKVRQHSHYELLQKASVSRMSETLSQAEREEQRKIEEALQELDNVPQHGTKLNQRNFQKVKLIIFVITFLTLWTLSLQVPCIWIHKIHQKMLSIKRKTMNFFYVKPLIIKIQSDCLLIKISDWQSIVKKSTQPEILGLWIQMVK